MKILLKLLIVNMVLFCSAGLLKVQAQEQIPFVPNEFIIKFKSTNSSAKTNHLITNTKAQVTKRISGLGVELWRANDKNTKIDVLKLVEEYKKHPDIEFIQPNYLIELSDLDIPNDTDFDKQWALHNTGQFGGDAHVDALAGWEIQSESPSVVVGILDTGIDWKHPDLINNIWQNLGEDADGDGRVLEQDSLGNWVFDPDDINGIDDDGNNYADDFIGWNFVENNNQPFDYFAKDSLNREMPVHGTHVAGIIGAEGNNQIGISGVTQNVQLAPIKIFSDEPEPLGNDFRSAQALRYAVAMGMQMSNNSYGGYGHYAALYLAIKAARNQNHLFITAAGNGGYDGVGDNNSELNYFPASYHWENIITVANTDYNDALAVTSNYSMDYVDIAAPGTNIYSCLPHNTTHNLPYGNLSGTSMAAPMVTGACALLWERYDSLYGSVNYEYVKEVIMESSDKLPGLTQKTVSGGRLNINEALSTIENLNGRQNDSLVLVKLYNTLKLDSINPVHLPQTTTVDYFDNWDIQNTPIDAWRGVTLNSQGRVKSLSLNIATKKVYQLPAEIGDLEYLTALSIIRANYHPVVILDNDVVIPDEIGNLSKLELLRLNGYQFTGSIPQSIGNLKNLEYLSLRNNRLSGSIPNIIGSMFRLKYIDFSHNELSGNIPEEIGELKNLEEIHITNNNLEGDIPGEIGNLINLTSLLLSYNSLTGPVPASFGQLNNIEILILSYNQLSGCYDPALSGIGGEQYSPVNGQISDGNNFEIEWELFNEGHTCWASTLTTVWPGDLNNDGIVDGADIIFFGLAIGNEGPYRSDDSTINNIDNTNWEAQLCPDWAMEVAGVNGKHQDANGDGVVDSLDYTVVLEKMDLQKPNYVRTENNLVYNSNGIELSLELVEVDEEQNIVFYDMYVNNLDGFDDGVNGVAGVIQFNNSIHTASVDFSQSCLDDTYSYTNFDELNNRAVFAITEADIQNIDCGGPVARVAVIITVEDAIPGDGSYFVSFKTYGINSQTDIAGLDLVNTSLNSTGFTGIGINSNEQLLQVEIDTDPQQCLTGGVAEAIISGGVPPYSVEWSTYQTTTTIHNLSAGNYSLTVADNAGNTVIMNFEIEEAIVDTYDENGELIACIEFNTSSCPNEINLDRDTSVDVTQQFIEPGTYQASQLISSDAKIYRYDEVEFKAGERIELKSGFSMEPNTELHITIENCDE